MSTRHDKDHLPPTLSQQPTNSQEVAWNKYLRRLEELRQQNKQDANGGELIGAAHFGQEGKEGQKKLEALKGLVIGGIPMHLRHQVWMELSDTRALVIPDEYAEYLKQRSVVEENEVDTILKDVSRTMTSLNDFFVDKGFEKLKNVLIAFVGKYKDLGYTQGLNTIAGCLLLAIPSEEDAFWTLCNIVENSFPKNYFSRADNMILPLADSTLLEKYIQQLLPRLGRHLKEVGFGETHPITVKWFFTAFSNTLRGHVLMRVWDVWLCMPNQKYFLFSFALALLAHNTDGLVRCEDSGDFLAYLDSELQIPEGEELTELLKEALRLSKKLGDVGERRSEEAAFLRLENKLQRRKTGSMEALVDREEDDDASRNGS